MIFGVKSLTGFKAREMRDAITRRGPALKLYNLRAERSRQVTQQIPDNFNT